MPNTKLPALTELTTGNLADADFIYVVDDSDTTDDASGTSKHGLLSSLWAYIEGKAVGKQTIWLPANAWVPITGWGTLPVAGTFDDTFADATKISYPTLDFDNAADGGAAVSIRMPKSFDEAINPTAFFVWKAASAQGAGNDGVAWAIDAGAYASSDDLGAINFNTPIVISQDHSATLNDVMITAVTAGVSIAGAPGAEELVTFRIIRDVSHTTPTPADDLDVLASLIGVVIIYTIDTTKDD